ncbi:MAG: rhodanese-like domain-containing protein [Betaproteobacteria bacterium]|nr:rhodanese-like domain-containing protein [Betaproteobacteria bacterium]
MATIEEILKRSRQRAEEHNLTYEGALLPSEAFELLQEREDAVLIDVRTRAECDYVGRIPGSIQIEWQTYPGGVSNPRFLEQLQQAVPKTSAALFICRSGARSHAAAAAAKSAGYVECFNVLEGFEGDKDHQGHRNSVGGWRFAGLPWIQS